MTASRTSLRDLRAGYDRHVEEILEGLTRSFRPHENEETVDVGAVLEAPSTSTDPEVLSALTALEAIPAPTRSHRGTGKHPESATRKVAASLHEQVHSWNDTHHGSKHRSRRRMRTGHEGILNLYLHERDGRRFLPIMVALRRCP